MSNCNCFGQSTKSVKNSSGSCFVCREFSSARFLKAGYVYEACSLLTQDPADKFAPYEPLVTPDQCVVGVVGDCAIDAMEWTEDCEAHIWKRATLNMMCINVPTDEEGAPLLTPDDLLQIRQGLDCCIEFLKQQDCVQKPDWLKDAGGKAEAVAR